MAERPPGVGLTQSVCGGPGEVVLAIAVSLQEDYLRLFTYSRKASTYELTDVKLFHEDFPAGDRVGPGWRSAGSPAAAQRARPGSRLTGEIVSSALALIERTGSDEAVTLRAVAREVGIAAPSIYAHFADRDAIVMAAVVRISTS